MSALTREGQSAGAAESTGSAESAGSLASASESQSARFERKSVVAQVDYSRLQKWVWDHPLAFRRAFPDRIVQSLYFDSSELGHLSDNLAGVSNRKKLRLRWYGDPCEATRAAFEIKCKTNEFGTKLRCDVELPSPISGRALARVVDDVARQLPAVFRVELEAASLAQLQTRYAREYWLSADGRVRATLDRDILVFGQAEGSRLNTSRPADFPPVAVLEVKYAAELDPWLRRHTTPFPSRMARFSKYTVGMQVLLGV